MDKKEIIKLLEQHFGVKAKYMGTPSFAYRIQAGEEIYTITREGNIENAAGEQTDLDSIIGGHDQVKEEVDSDDSGQDFEETEITLPLAGHTGISLKNLVNMIYSKQTLIQKALSIEGKLIKKELVAMLNDKKPETPEEFKSLLLEAGRESHPGITFDFEESRITFKFRGLSTEQIIACSELVVLINQNAKTLKHASSKPRDTDNDKYAFRTWLLRLGMIGNGYKAARKTLLKNLEGNGAFRRTIDKTE